MGRSCSGRQRRLTARQEPQGRISKTRRYNNQRREMERGRYKDFLSVVLTPDRFSPRSPLASPASTTANQHQAQCALQRTKNFLVRYCKLVQIVFWHLDAIQQLTIIRKNHLLKQHRASWYVRHFHFLDFPTPFPMASTTDYH